MAFGHAGFMTGDQTFKGHSGLGDRAVTSDKGPPIVTSSQQLQGTGPRLGQHVASTPHCQRNISQSCFHPERGCSPAPSLGGLGAVSGLACPRVSAFGPFPP